MAHTVSLFCYYTLATYGVFRVGYCVAILLVKGIKQRLMRYAMLKQTNS